MLNLELQHGRPCTTSYVLLSCQQLPVVANECCQHLQHQNLCVAEFPVVACSNPVLPTSPLPPPQVLPAAVQKNFCIRIPIYSNVRTHNVIVVRREKRERRKKRKVQIEPNDWIIIHYYNNFITLLSINCIGTLKVILAVITG